MPLYKSVEFARHLGISRGVVSVNISRGKLIIGPKKMIDSTHPINELFAAKYLKKKPVESPQEPKAPDPARVAKEAELKELMAMDKEAKRLQMDAKRKEMAVTEAKLQRMHGQLMPTDLVKVLFAQHFREVSTSIKQGMDGFLSEIAKKARLNSNQVAELRATITKFINESINRAVDNSKKSVEKVLKENDETQKAA